jgi:hypothetical protein
MEHVAGCPDRFWGLKLPLRIAGDGPRISIPEGADVPDLQANRAARMLWIFRRTDAGVDCWGSHVNAHAEASQPALAQRAGGEPRNE